MVLKKTKKADKKQISVVCSPCGVTANYLTCLKKYGKPPKKAGFSVSTFHWGVCQVCGHKDVPVTEARDFFYPDFNLIFKKFKDKTKDS